MRRAPENTPNVLLRDRREQWGWSQAELAKRLRASEITVRRWESGKMPSRYFLKKLCNEFQATAAELGLEPSPKSKDVSQEELSSIADENVPHQRTNSSTLTNQPTSQPIPERPIRQKISRRLVIRGIAIGGLSTVALGGAFFLVETKFTPRVLANYIAIHIYTADAGQATTVAWSPDGAHIACSFAGVDNGSSEHPVLIWDAKYPFKFLLSLQHDAFVQRVAWSYDSTLIASGGRDEVVKVWEAKSGKLVFEHQQNSTVDALVWSPKEMRIASGGDDHQVHVWHIEGDNIPFIYTNHTGRVWALAWSPDGGLIASGGDENDRTVQIWDANSGELIQKYTHHTWLVSGVAWSPDGKYIASSSFDGKVKVWEATTGETIFTYARHLYPVGSVAWSPDGKWIVSTAQTEVHVWNPFHQDNYHLYSVSAGVGWSCWSPDSLFIAICDGESHVLILQATS